MKAIVQNDYGSADVLKLAEVAQPGMKDNQVLVRVMAVPSMPGMCSPCRRSVADPFDGGVSQAQKLYPWLGHGWGGRGGWSSVTQFRPGDEVYASCSGALAEYVSVAEDKLALKPANLTFEQAAAIPTAAITALKGLRDVGKLQPGQKC